MKTRPPMIFFVVVCLALTMFACSPDAPAQNPTAQLLTEEPSTVTAVPATKESTNSGNTPVGSTPVARELSESQILQVVRSSLATYPWRLEQSVAVKATGQTSTSLTEAQSSTRGHNQSVQTLGTETVTIESILLDSKFYLKMSGSPAATYGLVDGQWTEVPPDGPLEQLIDRGAIDPARIAETFAADLAAVSGGSSAGERLFQVVGSEQVNGVSTSIYEFKGPTFTYRWWIGEDQRFYKSAVDIPEATRTILVEYDLDISIQPPIP